MLAEATRLTRPSNEGLEKHEEEEIFGDVQGDSHTL